MLLHVSFSCPFRHPLVYHLQVLHFLHFAPLPSACSFTAFRPPASPPRRHRRPVPFAHLRRVDSSAPLSFVYQTALSSFSILFLFSFFLSFLFSPFFSFTTTTIVIIIIVIIKIKININIFFSFTEKVLHYFSEHTFAFHSLLKCNISPLNPRRCSLCCSVVCISALTCACFGVLRVCVCGRFPRCVSLTLFTAPLISFDVAPLSLSFSNST
uniref:Uncharacterized protein TCIL3000_11_16690 n=1 Tax=Trypanosoma congolense (strain IL3000) TaxID=1068625 RepID=G0V3D2_TRYCI|nr:unnamed protein product [Trypanosoma congolense IL3000]